MDTGIVMTGISTCFLAGHDISFHTSTWYKYIKYFKFKFPSGTTKNRVLPGQPKQKRLRPFSEAPLFLETFGIPTSLVSSFYQSTWQIFRSSLATSNCWISTNPDPPWIWGISLLYHPSRVPLLQSKAHLHHSCLGWLRPGCWFHQHGFLGELVPDGRPKEMINPPKHNGVVSCSFKLPEVFTKFMFNSLFWFDSVYIYIYIYIYIIYIYTYTYTYKLNLTVLFT